MAAVSPVPREKAAPDVQPVYDQLAQTFGQVPSFYAVMAHRPAALKAFLTLYAAIMREGTVEPRLKELAYLKTSLLNGCEYCTRAHTAAAKRVGVTDEQIRALAFYERSPLFTEQEKAVVLYAERLTRGAAAMRDGTLEDLRAHFDEGQIVELTLVVCAANFTNRFNDGLRHAPDLG